MNDVVSLIVQNPEFSSKRFPEFLVRSFMTFFEQSLNYLDSSPSVIDLEERNSGIVQRNIKQLCEYPAKCGLIAGIMVNCLRSGNEQLDPCWMHDAS